MHPKNLVRSVNKNFAICESDILKLKTLVDTTDMGVPIMLDV